MFRFQKEDERRRAMKKEKAPVTRTTNYPKDSHADFCERCYKHNRACPNTGTKRRDRSCSL